MKTWQRHVTLLKTHDGYMPTARDTLVKYSHLPLTHIKVQVLYNYIRRELMSHKHWYFIYCLRSFLPILKFGYPASNIVIHPGQSSCALKISVTPLSLQSPTIYGLYITISYSSVATMKNTTNGYIDPFLLIKLALRHATDITRKNQHASPG